MASELERIAVLETQYEEVHFNQTAILNELKSLRETMTKYKGFVGGIMFTVSAIGTAMGALLTYWFQKS